MRLWQSLLILGCLSASASSILAQSQPTLTNIVQADGSIKALYESQAVVTTQFWLFHTNYNNVSNWETLGNGSSSFRRRGLLLPGTGSINASTQVQNGPNGSTFTMSAVPSRDVVSNNDHINVMFDDAFWAGSVFSDGANSFTFNPNFAQAFFKSGRGNVFTITRPDGFRLTITTPQSVKYDAQDSRNYHMGFELRLDCRSGNWTANTTRTYQATFKYSQASTTTPDAPLTITQGSDWYPLTQANSVTPGSALDWQDRYAAAAGSSGWLGVNNNGKFVFANAPSIPVRFYGANLTHYACFPGKSQAGPLADNLARMGYNAVRLHHIDIVLTNSTDSNSTTLDPALLDRLNYFVNELKKRGIYVSLDLHSLRKPRANEVMAGEVSEYDYKALLLVSNTARQNLLAYSSNLLNTLNPYTGLRWKDDPAIAWISLGNENTPFWMVSLRPEIKSMLDTAVGGSWNPLSTAGSRPAVNLAAQTAQYLATQLRSMGVKALFTDINAGFHRAAAIGRANLDYVDNHMYHAHPNGFALPIVQKNTSPLRKVEELGWFASSRIKGKPFTVSEFDAPAPNQFRAEFGIMAGAMGSVQQWDGMWRFMYASNMEMALTPQKMGLFSISTDPLGMATERAIVAMFLRGDVVNNEAPYQIANLHSTANHEEIRQEPIVRQSVLTRSFAQVNASNSNGSGIVYDGVGSTPNNHVSTDLNRLNFKVSTANTASVIGSEGQSLSTNGLSVTFTKNRASIYLTTVDKKPLTTSRRMLLAHLTDVQNTGATFSGQERGTLTSWGTLPHLVKSGAASVTVKAQYPTYMRVYRLDLAGHRTATVPFTRTSNSITFDVNTRDASGNGGIYYEIICTK